MPTHWLPTCLLLTSFTIAAANSIAEITLAATSPGNAGGTVLPDSTSSHGQGGGARSEESSLAPAPTGASTSNDPATLVSHIAMSPTIIPSTAVRMKTGTISGTAPATPTTPGATPTTPGATPTTPGTTPTTTTTPTTPGTTTTTPGMVTTTPGTTVRTSPRTTIQDGRHGDLQHGGDTPNRTGTYVVLVLLLIVLIICLYCAWKKLEEFGGRGSYYPCQLDKGLYADPEDGEGGEGGPVPVGRAFVAAIRNLLPRKPRPSEQELEELEGEEEGAEGEGGQPGDGGSEGESGGGQSEGGSSQRESEQPESDDYSSLGGLDLRERAGRSEEGGGEGEGEGGLPDPPSLNGDEFLSDLHSFSGTASWTDTNQDVTVL